MTQTNRNAALWVLLAGALAIPATAQAQYYPRGYAGYGWGGWGGSTVAGRSAAGMGVFAAGAGQYAAGAGQYNEETAQARAVNVQTAEQFNDYMYSTSKQHAQDYMKELSAGAAQNNQDYNELQDRILNNPNSGDISSGNTLNAIYMEVTAPKEYGKTLAAATAPVPGTMVRQLPFTYAAGGLTYSLGDLTSPESIPDVFSSPSFTAIRNQIRATVAELKSQTSGNQQPKPETLKKFRSELDQVKAILERGTQPNTDERNQGERYLKGLYGLTRMLESPSYDVYLAGVEKIPHVPLSEVLTFMHAFNLRFGPAKTPEQREMYAQLYGIMSALRTPGGGEPEQPAAVAAQAPQPGARPNQSVANFFAKMDYSHMAPPAAQPPPAPQPPR